TLKYLNEFWTLCELSDLPRVLTKKSQNKKTNLLSPMLKSGSTEKSVYIQKWLPRKRKRDSLRAALAEKSIPTINKRQLEHIIANRPIWN
ncbi:hypothetical protein Anas_13478, partial [Armadillidium nasatum]